MKKIHDTLYYNQSKCNKYDQTLTPSKLTHVDLNSKINFAICHWTWDIGCIWHFVRKFGDITPCYMVKNHRYFEKIWTTPRKLRTLTVNYQI